MYQKNKLIEFISILFFISIIFSFKKENFSFTYTAHAKKIYYQTNLEHEVNRLNTIFNAHSQCLVQIQQQLLENQQDLDILRGQIQDIQHHISEIIQNQKELYKKLHLELNKSNDDIKSKILQPTNLSEHTSNQINKKLINNVDAAYKSAVALVLEKKQYNQAIQAFQDFVKNYPKSSYQSNAHYWLGQLYYNQGDKNNASYHFALVVKNHPKSSKAADALLKIGIIMQETDQKDKAKNIYKQIGKLYPNSEAYQQAQKRLIHL